MINLDDLTNGFWFPTNLSEADLSASNMKKANLQGANLSGVDLRGANLSGAKLDDVQWPAGWKLVRDQ